MEMNGVDMPWFDLDIEELGIWESMELILEEWEKTSLAVRKMSI